MGFVIIIRVFEQSFYNTIEQSEKARLEERLSSTESDLKEKLATCQQVRTTTLHTYVHVSFKRFSRPLS